AALPAGTPRERQEAEKRLIENSCKFSKPDATIIYLSTIAVYGDPRPCRRIRWRSAYARAKLRSEFVVRRLGKIHRKKTYILRLGHVCGELQNITTLIRHRIGTGPVIMTQTDHASNTIYTATMVDAILKIIAGQESPGI